MGSIGLVSQLHHTGDNCTDAACVQKSLGALYLSGRDMRLLISSGR